MPKSALFVGYCPYGAGRQTPCNPPLRGGFWRRRWPFLGPRATRTPKRVPKFKGESPPKWAFPAKSPKCSLKLAFGRFWRKCPFRGLSPLNFGTIFGQNRPKPRYARHLGRFWPKMRFSAKICDFRRKSVIFCENDDFRRNLRFRRKYSLTPFARAARSSIHGPGRAVHAYCVLRACCARTSASLCSASHFRRNLNDFVANGDFLRKSPKIGIFAENADFRILAKSTISPKWRFSAKIAENRHFLRK